MGHSEMLQYEDKVKINKCEQIDLGQGKQVTMPHKEVSIYFTCIVCLIAFDPPYYSAILPIHLSIIPNNT